MKVRVKIAFLQMNKRKSKDYNIDTILGWGCTGICP